MVRFHNEGAELKFGDITDWNSLYKTITTSDLTNRENYNLVASQMDMENFITLIAMVQCSGYYSWGWGVSMYRPTNPIGKWKFSIWDSDRAYRVDKDVNVNWNGFTEAKTQYTSYKWGNNFTKHLMQNAEFNRLLVNRICDLLNTVYAPDNAITTLDSLYNIIKPEIPNELQRWNPTFTAWDTNIQNIRDYLTQRPEILKQQMINEFGLSGAMSYVTVNVSGHGKVKVNQYIPSSYPWTGSYFSSNAIDITAVPDSGYKFTGWNSANSSGYGYKNVLLKGDSSYTAYFDYDPYYAVKTKNINSNIKVFPNPARESATIQIEINKVSHLNVEVYSPDGRRVTSIFNGTATSGFHNYIWNCNNLTNGVYILKVSSLNEISTLKLIHTN
jgi:hypothetical protein